MSRDRLQVLQQRAQRWGSRPHRVRKDSVSVQDVSSSADGSDDSLLVLRRVDVIRADIQHITDDLTVVRNAQEGLLVAVHRQDRLDLQARLGSLCDRAKRAQLLLSSLDSLRQGVLSDSVLARIVDTQQMALSRSLLEVVEQVKECEEEFVAIVKKRQGRSRSQGIIADFTVLPLLTQRRMYSTQKTARCSEKVGKNEFDLEDEVASVDLQLAQIRQVFLAVAELVSAQSDMMDNIEHSV